MVVQVDPGRLRVGRPPPRAQAKKAGTALNIDQKTDGGSALTVDHKTKRSDRELMSYYSNRVGLSLYYTSTADNVLTEASLREIATAEKQLLADWAARFPGDGLSYSSGGGGGGGNAWMTQTDGQARCNEETEFMPDSWEACATRRARWGGSARRGGDGARRRHARRRRAALRGGRARR